MYRFGTPSFLVFPKINVRLVFPQSFRYSTCQSFTDFRRHVLIFTVGET
jgi:hypothetical protein